MLAVYLNSIWKLSNSLAVLFSSIIQGSSSRPSTPSSTFCTPFSFSSGSISASSATSFSARTDRWRDKSNSVGIWGLRAAAEVVHNRRHNVAGEWIIWTCLPYREYFDRCARRVFPKTFTRKHHSRSIAQYDRRVCWCCGAATTIAKLLVFLSLQVRIISSRDWTIHEYQL